MANILVIEDNERLRVMIGLALRPVGHVVREAEDGVQGVREYQVERPDLVLLDMFMPEKDGMETLRELRRLDPGVRVIAMTGGGEMNDMSILRPARMMGATAVLMKPFKVADLRDLVGKTLASEA